MTNGLKIAVTIAMGAMITSGMMPVAQAHDSNTLHKIGFAIQYTVRKDTENLDVDIHRAEHKRSVEADRQHNARFVVLPDGGKIYKGPNGRRGFYAHRNHYMADRHH